MNSNWSAPVHLIIGPEEQAISLVEEHLQGALCHTRRNTPQDASSDCFCRTCRQIQQRQHPAIIWIEPESSYNVKDVDIIFERTQFALDQGEQFFFVMPRIHTLNLATANKLLKIFEEPPAGYHFLLITQNKNAVLPTIFSRCVVHQLIADQPEEPLHPILNYVCNPAKAIDPVGFEALVKKEHLSDTQSVELLNQLLNHYAHKLKKLYERPELAFESFQERAHCEQIISFITQKLKQPPQSGSSELFWKLIFISFPRKSI